MGYEILFENLGDNPINLQHTTSPFSDVRFPFMLKILSVALFPEVYLAY